MRKKVRNVLIFGGICLIGLFVILYFAATRNTYDPHIYFSAEDAGEQWGLETKEDALFEYQDENFYFFLDAEKDLHTFRKDVAFWVVNDYFGISSINNIYAATVKDTLYIYGTTKREDVQRIKIVDIMFNEEPSEYYGKRIEDLNVLCFCLKIPADAPLGSSPTLAFIDSNNNIISELPETEQLLTPLLESVYLTEQTLNASDIEFQVPLELTEKKMEKYHLILKSNLQYSLEIYTEDLHLWFLEDFALLRTDRTTRFQTSEELIETQYNTAYKLEYSNELLKLREIAKQFET